MVKSLLLSMHKRLGRIYNGPMGRQLTIAELIDRAQDALAALEYTMTQHHELRRELETTIAERTAIVRALRSEFRRAHGQFRQRGEDPARASVFRGVGGAEKCVADALHRSKTKAARKFFPIAGLTRRASAIRRHILTQAPRSAARPFCECYRHNSLARFLMRCF